MAKLTFHGHSAVELELAGRHIWIDPFLTGNPKAVADPAKVSADTIVLTHGHGDHVGDTVAIAKRTGAVVVANYEICTWLGKQGVKNLEPANLGGTIEVGDIAVTFVQAHHSSAMDGEDGGIYMGNPAGVVITGGNKRVYHMGDTALFSDIRMITERRGPFDVAFVPTGDRYTMGLDDALVAARWINARLTIPVHFGTFPAIRDNGEDFIRKLARLGTNGQVFEPGKGTEF